MEMDLKLVKCQWNYLTLKGGSFIGNIEKSDPIIWGLRSVTNKDAFNLKFLPPIHLLVEQKEEVNISARFQQQI